MKRAVLYTRESPSLAENELTVESQIEAVKERIEKDDNTLVESYIDNGYAGDLLARPDLDRVRDDAIQNKFEVLYIFDRSRLARKYWLQELVVEELEEKGVEVIFVQEPKAETDEDKVLQGIKGVFFEYERAKIRERTRRGRLHRAKKGILVGHEAPYGYNYVRPDPKKEERRYEIDGEEAKIVRLIFEWVGNESCSLTEVRRRLYEKGIKAQKSGKAIWSNSTLSRLLRRTDYIGKAFYNKTLTIVPKNPRNNGYKRTKKTGRVYKPYQDWLPISVPVIVDENLFYRTQEQLKKNSFFNKRNQKSHYLLSGLLFCGCDCKARMAGDSQGEYRYYRSTDRIRKFPEQKTCTQLSVQAGLIEKIVWKKISELLNNPKLIMEQLQDINKRKAKEKEGLQQELLEIEGRDEKLNLEEERVLTAYRQEIISIDQLKAQIEAVKQSKKELESERNKLLDKPLQADIQVTPEMIEKYCAVVRKNLPKLTFEDKQVLLRLLVDKVIVKDRKITIQGVIPVSNEQIKDDSQSQFSGNSGFGRDISGRRGGRFIGFPSLFYNCRTSR